MCAARFFLVDSFADTAFHGNPAGVVFLDNVDNAILMQAIAAEFHLETAFVGSADDDNCRPLRWFTPVSEVDLNGHATLAAVHILGQDSVFDTRSGELTCIRNADGSVTMDFPLDEPVRTEVTSDIRTAFSSVDIVDVGRGELDTLVQVESATDVRNFIPDIAAISRIPARGVILTARGDDPFDVVSRCFYPSVGIPEDPVTGAAHCLLAGWWPPRLGKVKFSARQASPERGGTIIVELRGQRVMLTGHAVTVASGDIILD